MASWCVTGGTAFVSDFGMNLCPFGTYVSRFSSEHCCTECTSKNIGVEKMIVFLRARETTPRTDELPHVVQVSTVMGVGATAEKECFLSF